MSDTIHGLVLTLDNGEAASNVAALRAVQGLVERNDMEPDKQTRFMRDKIELLDQLQETDETLLIQPPESGEALAVLQGGYKGEPLTYNVVKPLQALPGVVIEQRTGLSVEPVTEDGLDLKHNVIDYIIER